MTDNLHTSIDINSELNLSMLEAGAPFAGYPKISRLNKEVIVTEKIDGTNALVYVDPTGALPPRAGSRTRWIEPGKQDNAGFAAWVEANRDSLFNLGPGYHYGEWWGGNIQRGYGVPDKRFSLFNVSRWSVDDDGGTRAPACCGVVPTLWRGSMEEMFARADLMPSPFDDILWKLRNNGSVAAPGYMKPEGIVIFHTASGTLFKKLLENDELPKGKVK